MSKTTVSMALPRSNGFDVAWSFFVATLLAYVQRENFISISMTLLEPKIDENET